MIIRSCSQCLVVLILIVVVSWLEFFLLIKSLACRIELKEMNGFSANSRLLEGSLLNERMEKLKMVSKQIKE